MIPVGVGRALVSSYGHMVEHALDQKKRKGLPTVHQVGAKSWIARALLGIRF